MTAGMECVQGCREMQGDAGTAEGKECQKELIPVGALSQAQHHVPDT